MSLPAESSQSSARDRLDGRRRRERWLLHRDELGPPAHVRRALDVYLSRAWPEGCGSTPTLTLEDLEGLDELDDLFGRFERIEGGGGGFKRYALRLGNSRYPFMKFVVQEHLVNGEYFFSVDTHDNLDIRRDNPDYEEWERLKGFNRDLKAAIERDWDRARLPTNVDLCALLEELARVEREGSKRQTILLVDDEAEVATGLAALLRARGYQVELARDGLEALERLACDPIPDLVLLDYEMPQLDGEASSVERIWWTASSATRSCEPSESESSLSRRSDRLSSCTATPPPSAFQSGRCLRRPPANSKAEPMRSPVH